ncbi:uncharacterized protein TrAtP1_012504 [Trichoderma atroviride]|uniref:uncharacterized protein n=1 Tax=Hypocrea atroviridis TaxID=63577 RepID=UPI003320435E|nr:hypothetical protein TrAtP1_012504 [Trichoderma atroviride]
MNRHDILKPGYVASIMHAAFEGGTEDGRREEEEERIPSEAPLYSPWAAVLDRGSALGSSVCMYECVCVWVMYARVRLSAVYETPSAKRTGRNKEGRDVKE